MGIDFICIFGFFILPEGVVFSVNISDLSRYFLLLFFNQSKGNDFFAAFLFHTFFHSLHC